MRGGVVIDNSCALTAESDTIWTLTTKGGKVLGPASATSFGTGLAIWGDYNLDGVDILINEWGRLYLPFSSSALRADTLTLDGAYALICHAPNATDPAPAEINRKYADKLILKNGASPAMYAFAINASIPTTINSIVFDLDSITVSNGTSIFGQGVYGPYNTGNYSYSIKDGGTLPVTIAAGASAKFLSYPTAGRIRVSGAGTLLNVGPDFPDVDFENFTGSTILSLSGARIKLDKLSDVTSNTPVHFSDSLVSIGDLSGYGSTLEISGATRIALPATSTWPSTFTVTVADDSLVYLPEGVPVDTTKILGTGNYLAVGRGMTNETAGTITVGAGEKLVICGDGFTADTAIIIAGGAIELPFNVTVASPVSINPSSSTAIVWRAAEAVFSGEWDINGTLIVDNQNKSDVFPAGRMVMTGTGNVRGGGVTINSGDMEFRSVGCVWTFGKATILKQTNAAMYLGITQGATVDLLDGVDNSAGYTAGCSVLYLPTLEITTGATMKVGPLRQFRLGSQHWRGHTEVIIDGGRLEINGYIGEFNSGGNGSLIDNTSANDRNPMAVINIKNGGVLETDRIFCNGPVSHILDIDGFTEGLFLNLDGGTYKLGVNFGFNKISSSQTIEAANLFGGCSLNALDYKDTTYTAEIMVTIGEDGGTFDLSGAREGLTSFTNTVMNKLIATTKPAFPSGYYPNLGPRWEINGRLNVKGNGNQEFVINGIDAAVLSEIGSEGVAVKVISDNNASVTNLTLGANGGGWKIETEAGAAKSLDIAEIDVSAGGTYDASAFDLLNTTVGNIFFGPGATLMAKAVDGNVPVLTVTGSVTLDTDMQFFATGASACGAAVLSAGGGIVPENGIGVTWAKAPGSSDREVVVRGNDIFFNSKGILLLFK